MKLPLGSMVVFDKGFTDYGWNQTLMKNGTYFVTRLKSNTRIKYLRKRSGRKAKGISMQQMLRLLQLNLFERRNLIELFLSQLTLNPLIVGCFYYSQNYETAVIGSGFFFTFYEK